MISGITDPEIEDMIIVVGATQNAGDHSSWEIAGIPVMK